MKKAFLLFFSILHYYILAAQPAMGTEAEARELYNTARNFLLRADYANAIMVYQQAIQLQPFNLVYRRELAHAYYLQGDLARGEKMVRPLLKRDDADEETFVTACRILYTMKNMDDAKSAINKGIDKFPNSGILYAEKGELYTKQKKYKDASRAWEKGIEKDPRYHQNYYNLAKVYFFTRNYLWAILYGETYMNMESFTSKTEEIKKNVFESYKFLIADLNAAALDGKSSMYDKVNTFEKACLSVFNGLRNVVTGGINTDNLIMLRTRFLLDWNRQYASKYPLELLDHQQRLLLAGHYDTYNQWLFGKLDNAKANKAWTQKNSTKVNEFDTYFRNNKLQPKDQQYYRTF